MLKSAQIQNKVISNLRYFVIIIIIIINSFYIALFSALEQTHRACHKWFWKSDCILLQRILISTEVVYW